MPPVWGRRTQDFFFFVIFLHLEGQVYRWAEGLLRPGQASKGTRDMGPRFLPPDHSASPLHLYVSPALLLPTKSPACERNLKRRHVPIV